MKKIILNQPEHEKLIAETIRLAEGLLSGDVEYLEAVNRLCVLRFKVCDSDYDKDFAVFIGINDDTDHMPYGNYRNKCSEKWLEECDKKLEEIKEFYKDRLSNSCRSILKRSW